MHVRLVLAFPSLLLPATTFADSPDPAVEEVTTSYRHQTLAMDGLGVALLVAGGFAEGEDGRDTDASDALFAVGGLTAFFGTPIIHAARGHGMRALGSVGLRGLLGATGMTIAMTANSGCEGLLCELDYIGYGMLGGLVVASVIDAAAMTDERVEPARWAPQVAASDDGVRVGAAFVW